MLSTFVYLILAVLILMFMITIHEVGHYVAGKLLGFKINEFSIGFGKALYKRTSKKTGEVFAIRLIPLGGYCAFEGDDADSLDGKTEVNEQLREEGAKDVIPFSKMPPWKRLIVLFSGAFFNFLSAILFAVILLMAVGYNNVVVVGKMANEAPTENRWLEGQTIHAIQREGSDKFEKFTLLKSFTNVLGKCNEGDTITVQYSADGKTILTGTLIVKKLTPADGSEDYVGIGIITRDAGNPSNAAHIKYVKMGFFPAIGKSFMFCFELAWMVLSFFGLLIAGKISLSSVGGPITTVSVMTQSLSAGFINILILVPLISVNLAVFNLLPVPALDGARMVFVGIEWARGKPINPKLENKIHFIGIICLFAFVFIADINHLIHSCFYLLTGRLRL